MDAKRTGYVDPFIGVDGGGNCLCGPYLPFSLVRLGPDTLRGLRAGPDGYSSEDPIVCFSHTHVSGTGGGGRYGNVGITPFVGKSRISVEPYNRSEEHAEPGYYTALLEPANIKAELTVTPRVGVHRYSFPSDATANILLDLGAVIQTSGGSPQKPGRDTGASIGGYLEFVSESEIAGRGDFRGGWGHEFPYSVYFFARFDQPCEEGRVADQGGMFGGKAADGPNCKAVAGFGQAGQVNLAVGISFVSVAKARASVDREKGPRDFNRVRETAAFTWESYLSRVSVQGGTEEQRKLFYSLFTRLVCMPTDLGVDDEFPLWESGVRHYSDYYCLWDSVRNANSFISLFDPDVEVSMLNCLLDIAGHNGWLPDAWIAGHSAFIQGGSSADVLLCEAALNGFKDINFGRALDQVRKNNEVVPPDPRLYGRYLEGYRDLGYVPTGVPNCVSRHIEYAYQDWCIGALAEQQGKNNIAEQYFKSSARVWNLWRDDLKCFAPKRPDGKWVEPFDPYRPARKDYWNDPHYYEGIAHEWSLCVLHDIQGLIRRHGGTEAFMEHLDRFFNVYMHHWKEMILHTPYLYHYAGRPDRSTDQARRIAMEKYKPTRAGLPDNEDMGANSAFYMCTALGLYPIMGQGLYLLSTPFFEESRIQLGSSGKALTIQAPGATGTRKYIVDAKLNGKPLTRSWVRYNELATGGTLELTLSDTPEDWGTMELPPSPLQVP